MTAEPGHVGNLVRQLAEREDRRAGRRSRRAVFACMKLAAVVVVAAVLATGYLVARLSYGPLAIGGLLGPSITGALNSRFGNGLRFTLGDISLAQRGFSPSLSDHPASP